MTRNVDAVPLLLMLRDEPDQSQFSLSVFGSFDRGRLEGPVNSGLPD